MNGFLGKDIVQVSSSLSTPSNQLLAVIKSQIKGSGARLYDGILGIGPDPLSFVQDNVTPFSNLVKANKLTRPLVGIALVKKNKLTNAPGGGEFRWGSVNNNYISGSILYTPVTSAYYWGIDIPGVYMNNMQLYGPGESKRAILDTGTTLVYVSTPLAATIHSKIPGSSFNTQEGAWYVPCDVSNLPRPGNLLGDPNVFFEIGGRKWGIPIQDVAFRTSGRSDGLCVSGIQGGSNQFMVLGDVFIKNHCEFSSFPRFRFQSLCGFHSFAGARMLLLLTYYRPHLVPISVLLAFLLSPVLRVANRPCLVIWKCSTISTTNWTGKSFRPPAYLMKRHDMIWYTEYSTRS